MQLVLDTEQNAFPIKKNFVHIVQRHKICCTRTPCVYEMWNIERGGTCCRHWVSNGSCYFSEHTGASLLYRCGFETKSILK